VVHSQARNRCSDFRERQLFRGHPVAAGHGISSGVGWRQTYLGIGVSASPACCRSRSGRSGGSHLQSN
jgi:hypothetical protein